MQVKSNQFSKERNELLRTFYGRIRVQQAYSSNANVGCSGGVVRVCLLCAQHELIPVFTRMLTRREQNTRLIRTDRTVRRATEAALRPRQIVWCEVCCVLCVVCRVYSRRGITPTFAESQTRVTRNS